MKVIEPKKGKVMSLCKGDSLVNEHSCYRNESVRKILARIDFDMKMIGSQPLVLLMVYSLGLLERPYLLHCCRYRGHLKCRLVS